MKKDEIERLAEKRDGLLRRLAECAEMVRGSLVETGKKCGRKECECAKGKLHPHRYLSFSEKGRNKTVYVADAEKKRFAKGTKAYEKAWELICRISELNIKIIKKESGDVKTRQG